MCAIKADMVSKISRVTPRCHSSKKNQISRYKTLLAIAKLHVEENSIPKKEPE
jgi:hypothetical protein